MKPQKSWELGLEADCWFCSKHFTKKEYCSKCGYYICPHCGKCGCHLSPDQRSIMDKTFAALAPILKNRAVIQTKKMKALAKIYKQMISLEYILDSENQKRKRQDKQVKKAWGHAFAIKGMIIDTLDYYQPTLMVFPDKECRTKVNPTWTKRAKMIYEITQRAKTCNSLSEKTIPSDPK